jgi:hypothetical protein
MDARRDIEQRPRFTDEELTWIAGHRSELRRNVSERRYRSWILWLGLAIGLVVHIIGFQLKASTDGAAVAILAELLYALGFALWTGVVVVTLIDIIPAAKERQVSRWLDAAEEELRSRAAAPGDAGATPSTRTDTEPRR